MGLFDDTLQTGDKRDVHLSLFEGEIVELDRLAAEHKCSRSAVIGALVKKYRGQEIALAK